MEAYPGHDSPWTCLRDAYKCNETIDWLISPISFRLRSSFSLILLIMWNTTKAPGQPSLNEIRLSEGWNYLALEDPTIPGGKWDVRIKDPTPRNTECLKSLFWQKVLITHDRSLRMTNGQKDYKYVYKGRPTMSLYIDLVLEASYRTDFKMFFVRHLIASLVVLGVLTIVHARALDDDNCGGDSCYCGNGFCNIDCCE